MNATRTNAESGAEDEARPHAEPVDPPLETDADEIEAANLVRMAQFVEKHAPGSIFIKNPTKAPRKRRQRKPPRARVAVPSAEARSLAAHEARCHICSHPNRDAIEEEFVHWHDPRMTAHQYRLDRRAIYRHAHALNLFAIRDRNLRYSLGHIIESASEVTVTADTVIRAVHAFTRVNNEGQWVEPPSHVIVSSGSRPVARAPQRPPFDVIDQPALPEGRLQNSASNVHAPLDTAGPTERGSND